MEIKWSNLKVTYGLFVRLVTVIARGQIPYSRNRKSPASLWIRILPIKISELLEQLLNGFLIKTDKIRSFGNVVAVPIKTKKKKDLHKLHASCT